MLPRTQEVIVLDQGDVLKMSIQIDSSAIRLLIFLLVCDVRLTINLIVLSKSTNILMQLRSDDYHKTTNMSQRASGRPDPEGFDKTRYEEHRTTMLTSAL